MADPRETPTIPPSPPYARPASGEHPLGPLLRRMPHPRPWSARLVAAAVLAGCVAVLGLALWMQPDRHGVGTHRQLGLPPCSLVQVAGIPCPTCGMTTAFAHLVRGRAASAFLTQPFAFLLAVAVVLCVPLSLQVLWTAKTWRINWYRLSPNRVASAILVLFLLSWGYKVLHHLAQSR